jgi:hypothetical protein
MDISIRKSPLTPLCQRGGIPPFCKACLPVGRGGKEGFSLPCLYNYGLTNMLLNNNTPKKGTDDESLTLFS